MYIQRRRSLRQSINNYAVSVRRFNYTFDVNKINILHAMMHLWVIRNSLFLKLSERDGRTQLSSRFSPHIQSFCQFSNQYLLLPERSKILESTPPYPLGWWHPSISCLMYCQLPIYNLQSRSRMRATFNFSCRVLFSILLINSLWAI